MRLTNAMREEIINGMVDFYIPDESEQLNNQILAIATEEALRAIPTVIDQAYNLYPGYIRKDPDVRIKKPGQASWFSDDSIQVRMKCALPCADSYHFIELPGDHPIYAIAARRQENIEKRGALREKISAVVNAVTTSKQLIEALPEAARFVPDESTRTLVPVTAINELRTQLASL